MPRGRCECPSSTVICRAVAVAAANRSITRLWLDASRDFVFAEITEPQQQIVQPIGALHAARGIELADLLFDCFDRGAVEQLAQLRVAEQRLQLRVIDRQRLRAAFGQRRVAVIDVVRDVAEQQRRRER